MNNQEKLTQFMSISGADEMEGFNALEATNWNLEEALQLYFEGGNTASTQQANYQANQPISNNTASTHQQHTGQTDVRPSMQFNDQPQSLYHDVDIDEDMEQVTTHSFQSNPMRYMQELAEQHLGNIRDVFTGGIFGGSNARPTRQRDNPLGKAFNPPTDIMFNGPFQEAMRSALQQKKWLLVNIQSDQELASHNLNKDTWKSEIVRTYIPSFFVFWQVEANSPDGQRYCTYYPTASFPHIAIIDPRSGERVKFWTGFIEPAKMAEHLNTFMDNNTLEVYDIPMSIDNDIPSETFVQQQTQQHPNSFVPINTQNNMLSEEFENYDHLDADEDLINAAIAASLENLAEQNKVPQEQMEVPQQQSKAQGKQPITTSSTATTENASQASTTMATPELVSPPQQMAPQLDVTPFLADASDKSVESTRVQLRKFDGSREAVALKTSAPVAVIYQLFRNQIATNPDIANRNFEVVMFDKTLPDDSKVTLKDMGISNCVLTMRWA